ncbi:unnamed protein product, partial [Brenthis ino]
MFHLRPFPQTYATQEILEKSFNEKCWYNNKWISCSNAPPNTAYPKPEEDKSRPSHLFYNSHWPKLRKDNQTGPFDKSLRPFQILIARRHKYLDNLYQSKHANQNNDQITSNNSRLKYFYLNNEKDDLNKRYSLSNIFTTSLDRFENLFYQVSFNKLTSISPQDRKENGISFAQTGLFLYMALMVLSTAVDSATKSEIVTILDIKANTTEHVRTLETITSWFPLSSQNLKFRWASRLLVNARLPVSQSFKEGAAKVMNMKIIRLNGTETSEYLTRTLNSMVEIDSAGALRNTFEEDDLNIKICSILIMTSYIRASWRSAPTVLNGTKPFYDSEKVKPDRSVRMIRLNDIMRYAALEELNAEAIEINYATPGLTLLLLVPKSYSLKKLAAAMARIRPYEISDKMSTMRIAATIPLYTLRMTLLLPEKLRKMGITRLVNNDTCTTLKLSHAVQRLMFWSEPGRNAYKDDGIEWDEVPEREIIVNRPYLFYVRWHNITLMNGNFVL